MSSEKVHTPLPPSETIYKDDPRAILSTAEQSMYEEVLAHFASENSVYTLPGVEKKGELQDREKFWLSRECILRCILARFQVETRGCYYSTGKHLKWRREFGIYGDIVSAKHVEPEAVTGKEIVFGYDTKGRPGFYMIPSRQNTDEATRQIQFAFWMVERCVDLMEPGVENLTLLINFADRAKNPALSTARAVLNILQEHYPERLGMALIINVPYLVNMFFKIIMPFVDPVTREKVKFNPDIYEEGYFTKDMTMKEWGGDQDFKYVHKTYWPSLLEMCEERSSAWMKSWEKLGGKVGISEWDYKKGSEVPGPIRAVEVAEKQPDVAVLTVITTKEIRQDGEDVEKVRPSPEIDPIRVIG